MRNQPLAVLWVGGLCVCLCLLAGCQTAPPSEIFPPNLALIQTRNAQVIPDVLFHLVGTYTGTVEWHGRPVPTPLRLQITEQDENVLSGVCLLGVQQAPLVNDPHA